jgi:hypothetical protein
MAEFYEDIDSGDDITEEVKPEPVVESKIPSKYVGKSIEDIVAMHQEAEKLIGRQGQEIGEVRKLADELIKSTFKKEKPVEESVDDDTDFFVDPKKAIDRAIESHPKIKQAEEKAADYEKQRNYQLLKSEHPDMHEVVESDDFIEWVAKSKIRKDLYTRADANFDFDAGNELLSLYKELKGIRKEQTADVAEIKETADRNLKKASVSAGSSQEAPKKIYRRADLMKLLSTDPDRYDAMQDEIMRAYAEGRVK